MSYSSLASTKPRFPHIVLRIIEDFTDGLLILNPRGEVVFFNEMLLRMTGWHSKDIFVKERIFLDHLELDGGGEDEKIVHIPDLHGENKRFRINVLKIMGEDGLFALIRIRRLRREDETGSCISNEHYEVLYHNLSDPLMTADLKGRIISANSAFYTMLDYDESRGPSSINDVYVYRTALEDKLMKISGTGNLDRLETYLYTKRKSIRRVEDCSWAVRDRDGAITGYTTHFRDVTYLRNLESRLQISEHNYVMLFDSIISSIILVDPMGTVLNGNYAAEQLYGYSWEDMSGRSFDDTFTSDKNRPPLKKMLEKVDDNEGRYVETNVPRLCRDGVIKYTYSSYAWIRNSEDDVIAYAIMERDLTERVRLEAKLKKAFESIKETQSAAILGFAKLTEYRDKDAGRHLHRIREYARILANRLRELPKYARYLTEEYVEDLCIASILHDIGKVGIDDDILTKPDRLNTEEFEKMKLHARIGGEALAAVDKEVRSESFLTIGKEIALHHHQRWDGWGYPGNKKEDEIPLSARIIAVADVYDALTTEKPYREAFSHEDAVLEIESERGTHFDPDVVTAFLEDRDLFRRIKVFGEFQDNPETIDDLLKGNLKVDLSELDLGN